MQWGISYLLLLACARLEGQRLLRACLPTEECTLITQCPEVLDQYQETKKLPRGSERYDELLEILKTKVCNKVTKKVCCRPVERKISGSVGPTDPNEFPFMVRLTIRGADGLIAHCGASLIAPKYLASAWHCFYNANPDIQFDRD